MAVFNIPRAGRNKSDYGEQLIQNMYYHPNLMVKKGYGICDSSPESILYSFNAVRNQYCKINRVKVYSLEILMKREEFEMVHIVLERLGRVLFDMGFQSFICVIDDGKQYIITAAVNAVSYVNGSLFYDNNRCLGYIYFSLIEAFPQELKLEISDNTFFDPEVMDGNYMHGICM